jgi:hypothetical protein
MCSQTIQILDSHGPKPCDEVCIVRRGSTPYSPVIGGFAKQETVSSRSEIIDNQIAQYTPHHPAAGLGAWGTTKFDFELIVGIGVMSPEID